MGLEPSGVGFGPSLPTGPLAAAYFRAGSSNQGQDANDRFVLRTTDKTLWFDPDGKGGAASILIADLQDSAVFGASDIVIF